jgi:prepilin-type N-terminal cleavage/methylation domain-containing protein
VNGDRESGSGLGDRVPRVTPTANADADAHAPRPRRTGSGSTAGFTLLELLITIVVSLILAGVVLPNMHTLDDQRVSGAVRVLEADIDFVRARAIATSQIHRILFDVTKDEYQVESPPGVVIAEPLSKRPWVRQLPVDPDADAAIAAVDFGGTAAVSFDGAGTPSTGGVVRLSTGKFTAVLTLEPVTGETSIEYP